MARRFVQYPNSFKPHDGVGPHGLHPTPPNPSPSPHNTTRHDTHRHRRFVKRVHAFRIPLSPAGQRVAQMVYFSIPVICGYFIMDWATSKAWEEIEFGGAEEGSGRPAASAAVKGKEDPARVLGNMRIDPGARGRAVEQEGIRVQNEAMRKYLQSLNNKAQAQEKQQQQRPS